MYLVHRESNYCVTFLTLPPFELGIHFSILGIYVFRKCLSAWRTSTCPPPYFANEVSEGV